MSLESKSSKMLIAGVGGQGVVFLTSLLVEASMQSGVPVATSEIHGLSQRGGSVMAGLTFGANTFGFVEKGGADFLLGLEPLEVRRCIAWLNPQSRVVMLDRPVNPAIVNSGGAAYPETKALAAYLEEHIAELVCVQDLPAVVEPRVRNLFLLGVASGMQGFPVTGEAIDAAIGGMTRESRLASARTAFQTGRAYFAASVRA